MVNWTSRLVLGALSTLLICVAMVILILSLQVRRERAVVAERHAQLTSELNAIREERMEKEAYLRAFLKDRDFVERVVRERLGYVGPGEVLFRFDP